MSPMQSARFKDEKNICVLVMVSAFAHAALLATFLLTGPDTRSLMPIGLTLELLEPHTAGSVAPAAPIVKTHRTKPAPVASDANDNTSVASDQALPSAPVARGESSTAPIGQTAQEPSEMSSYVSEIIAALQRSRMYPKDALRREEEGVVALSVRVGADGNIIEVHVKTPSPFESLNLAAVKSVERVGQFPKPPVLKGDSIQLTIPMRFQIDRL